MTRRPARPAAACLLAVAWAVVPALLRSEIPAPADAPRPLSPQDSHATVHELERRQLDEALGPRSRMPGRERGRSRRHSAEVFTSSRTGAAAGTRIRSGVSSGMP